MVVPCPAAVHADVGMIWQSARVARRLPYRDGDWFAVPLRSRGFGVGTIACHDGRGGVIGYFVGERFEQLPTFQVVNRFSRADALRVLRFGDLGLIRSAWPVIGRSEAWSSVDWPVPAFGRRDVSGRCYRVEYDPHDLRQPYRELEVEEGECNRLPRDALAGSGAVEKLLTSLLESDG